MSFWNKNINKAKELLGKLESLDKDIDVAGEVIVDRLKAGNKVLACGNGGSAAQASHFMTELIGRYIKERQSLPGICLNSDGSALTCIVNDYDPQDVFMRQVSALGAQGDILVVLTTSGKSENIIRAVMEAKDKKMIVISLIGKDGGALKGMADYEIHVPHMETARIQEAHILAIHTLCDYIDEAF